LSAGTNANDMESTLDFRSRESIHRNPRWMHQRKMNWRGNQMG